MKHATNGDILNFDLCDLEKVKSETMVCIFNMYKYFTKFALSDWDDSSWSSFLW
jgi:hypothetical protein